jgi:hypothetical protein
MHYSSSKAACQMSARCQISRSRNQTSSRSGGLCAQSSSAPPFRSAFSLPELVLTHPHLSRPRCRGPGYESRAGYIQPRMCSYRCFAPAAILCTRGPPTLDIVCNTRRFHGNGLPIKLAEFAPEPQMVSCHCSEIVATFRRASLPLPGRRQ